MFAVSVQYESVSASLDDIATREWIIEQCVSFEMHLHTRQLGERTEKNVYDSHTAVERIHTKFDSRQRRKALHQPSCGSDRKIPFVVDHFERVDPMKSGVE